MSLARHSERRPTRMGRGYRPAATPAHQLDLLIGSSAGRAGRGRSGFGVMRRPAALAAFPVTVAIARRFLGGDFTTAKDLREFDEACFASDYPLMDWSSHYLLRGIDTRPNSGVLFLHDLRS